MKSKGVVELTISTGTRTAIVNFLFAVKSGVTHWATAAVAAFWVVCASTSVEAGAICTSHCTQFTVLPVESRWTSTRIAVF